MASAAPAISSPRPAVTRDLVLQHAQSLPAAPQVLGGLCELLEDINTDLDQIAEQIRIDPALASRVLRISNSVIFGGGSVATSIDEAVLRVGFSEVTRLVGLATVAGLADRALQAYGIPVERLRESLLLHGLASEALAERVGLEPRIAYSLGLLRGVGMMVLDRVARTRLGEGENFDPAAHGTYAQWEQAKFGLTSTSATTMLLDEWRFPGELVVAIERHVAPRGGALAHVLNLAGGVVAAQGLALAGEEKLWIVTEEKLAGAGLDEEAFREASERAVAAFTTQRQGLY